MAAPFFRVAGCRCNGAADAVTWSGFSEDNAGDGATTFHLCGVADLGERWYGDMLAWIATGAARVGEAGSVWTEGQHVQYSEQAGAENGVCLVLMSKQEWLIT